MGGSMKERVNSAIYVIGPNNYVQSEKPLMLLQFIMNPVQIYILEQPINLTQANHIGIHVPIIDLRLLDHNMSNNTQEVARQFAFSGESRRSVLHHWFYEVKYLLCFFRKWDVSFVLKCSNVRLEAHLAKYFGQKRLLIGFYKGAIGTSQVVQTDVNH